MAARRRGMWRRFDAQDQGGDGGSLRAINGIVKRMDVALAAFAGRRLEEEAFPHLILDGRCEQFARLALLPAEQL